MPWHEAWAAGRILPLYDDDYMAFVADPDWRIRFLAQYTSPGEALEADLFITAL